MRSGVGASRKFSNTTRKPIQLRINTDDRISLKNPKGNMHARYRTVKPTREAQAFRAKSKPSTEFAALARVEIIQVGEGVLGLDK